MTNYIKSDNKKPRGRTVENWIEPIEDSKIHLNGGTINYVYSTKG